MIFFKSVIKKVLVAVGLTALLSCAGSNLSLKPPAEILIDGLIIQNLTEETIHDFVLKVENVKNHISVTPILDRNSFSTSFPLRKYQKNQISITWTQGGRRWMSGYLIIEPPDDLVPGRPATVMILIRENGNVMTTMSQL
jgi:hypothetical protein